jgi:hypothetical protein
MGQVINLSKVINGKNNFSLTDFYNYLHKVWKWEMCAKKWEVLEQEPLRKERDWSRKTGVHRPNCVVHRPNCVVQMGLRLRKGESQTHSTVNSSWLRERPKHTAQWTTVGSGNVPNTQHNELKLAQGTSQTHSTVNYSWLWGDLQNI